MRFTNFLLPAVHHAAAAQPAALRLRVRPDGPAGCRDDAQHGEAQPAVAAVHRLLPQHLHASGEPGLLPAGLHAGRPPAEDAVPGDGPQRHLQVEAGTAARQLDLFLGC